jgi:hypothetical protein
LLCAVIRLSELSEKMSTEPPKKKRKVAKNKKKTWRKHIDISEIEEFLEDERLQERTG